MKKLKQLTFIKLFSFVILFCSFVFISGCGTVKPTFTFRSNAKQNFYIDTSTPPIFKSVEMTNTGDDLKKGVWLIVNDKDWSDTEGIVKFFNDFNPDAKTTHQKIMTLWAFIDKYMYSFHPPIGNNSIHDIVCNFNRFGYGLCDDQAHIMEGFVVDYLELLPQDQARVWALSGHVVPEFYYDGMWHSPDADIAYYSTCDVEALAVSDLAGQHNSSILSAHKENPDYGARVAQIYSSGNNNSVIQMWRNKKYPLSWNMWPGETVCITRQNNGMFYDAISPRNPPPLYSSGKISLHPLRNFPESLYHHKNVSVKNGKASIIDLSEEAEIILQVQSPYVMTGSTVQFKYNAQSPNDITAEISRDRKNWETLKNDFSNKGECSINVGKQKSFQSIYDFYTYFYLRISFKNKATISHLNIEADFQVSTKSLPELKIGKNTMSLKSGPAPIRVIMDYEELGFLPWAPSSLNYNQDESLLNWDFDGKKIPNLAGFEILVSSDPSCLWPIQPKITQKQLSKNSRSYSLKNMAEYLLPNRTYYFKITAIYDAEGEKVLAQSEPFEFKYFENP